MSYIITFLIGALTGAVGKYFADKYTDQRRRKETLAHLHKQFLDTALKMPNLIKDMKQDINNSHPNLVREFVILPNKRVSFGASGRKYFFYYEEEHPDLLQKVKLLEDRGFVSEISSSSYRAPRYRMTDGFVNCILKTKIKNNVIKI